MYFPWNYIEIKSGNEVWKMLRQQGSLYNCRLVNFSFASVEIVFLKRFYGTYSGTIRPFDSFWFRIKRSFFPRAEPLLENKLAWIIKNGHKISIWEGSLQFFVFARFFYWVVSKIPIELWSLLQKMFDFKKSDRFLRLILILILTHSKAREIHIVSKLMVEVR